MVSPQATHTPYNTSRPPPTENTVVNPVFTARRSLEDVTCYKVINLYHVCMTGRTVFQQ